MWSAAQFVPRARSAFPQLERKHGTSKCFDEGSDAGPEDHIIEISGLDTTGTNNVVAKRLADLLDKTPHAMGDRVRRLIKCERMVSSLASQCASPVSDAIFN